MRVVWTEPGLDDVFEISDYLQGVNPVAAVKVTRTLRMAANGLTAFPHRGRRVRGTEMREIGTKYPYLIRYRVEGEAVYILRIRHTARRPTKP